MMISEDIFVILHTDLNIPYNYDGYITIEFKDNSNDKILIKIDYDFIANILGETAPLNFRPSSFDMLTLNSETGNYELIVVDSINGLLFIEFTVDEVEKKVNLKKLLLKELTKLLNDNG